MSTQAVHEPFRAGVPALRPYALTVWRRRVFALELARSELRAQHVNTAFGQLWLVINPLLLAAVYFVLIDILSGGSRDGTFFAHLVACLFAFTFVQQSLQLGVKSVVEAGQLILNTSFPRALLPLSALLTAFLRFVPMLAVYAVIHVVSGLPLGPELLIVPLLLVLLVVLTAGLTCAAATAQVYFADLKSFLPYALRAWLYASPILYLAAQVPERYDLILVANPLAPWLAAWSDVLVAGRMPSTADLALAAGWALVLCAAGGLLFVSREREFAVRV